MAPRRDKRRYGREAEDVRRGGVKPPVPPVSPTIKEIDVWFRVNGADIANSNSVQAMTALTEREVVTATQILDLEAGDYIQLMFAVNDLNMTLNALVADAVAPAAPSIIVNITQVE